MNNPLMSPCFGSRISVIVPTLNEAAHLATTLSSIVLTTGDELIVVDGGSRDATLAVARQFTSHVLQSPPGRARQMNCGAQHAQGDILLFVHADTLLPPDGLAAVRLALRQSGIVGGAFRLAITPATLALRLVAWGTNLRARFGRLPYGDQALFVSRHVFAQLDGYGDLPFMEDVYLVRLLRRHGRLAILSQTVQTSSRRWQRDGVCYTTVRNILLVTCYLGGVSPATLQRWYAPRKKRSAKQLFV